MIDLDLQSIDLHQFRSTVNLDLQLIDLHQIISFKK